VPNRRAAGRRDATKAPVRRPRPSPQAPLTSRVGARPGRFAASGRPEHRVTERSVAELGRILADHPGDSPVHLSVRGPRTTTLYALRATVDATTLASDVKGAFGVEAWVGLP